MVTIKEIAKECGVSTATVSNILNGKKNVGEETRARVMAVVERTGYKLNYIAQGLRKQKTQTIGIIAEDIGQFTTPEMIEGVMEVCEENGYRTIVQNLRFYSRWNDIWFDNETMCNSVMEPAVREMASIRVDGIIYIAGHARNISRFPSEYNIPSVLAYAYSQDKKVPSVVIDDEDAARVVVKYLIDHGHRKIGVLAGEQDNLHAQLRILGYQKALYDAGILYDPELVIYAGWGKEFGYRESAKILEKGVTAVFCMSDQIAGGLYQYLFEHNMQAGKDISVVGFDNQVISDYFMPGLTTTKIDLIGIGRTAMNMLLDKLDGKETEQLVRVPCKMIKRQSVMVKR
ncbi:LacI family transcriptional regulator [Butyrivibrio sp. XB500-5]|uniref:LacI family DNA-binding transcriptional regulator n=1 Tax=Butyrivibrio sp. XB500-5 TaxID=2364880 RepID=UPI000EA93248|nr:LacI family DNA-binding transcriptional regulator [Butyrivibrio sp. XB500-5]RKM58539.1 LacI family transcriptional regulator [Butyrivibrio sp. XB500-5]